MIDKPKFIEELAQKICAGLPEGLAGFKELKEDTQKNIKAVVQAGFERMSLVTQEEFEVQKKILERTKSEMNKLEQQVKELEAKLNGAD